MKLQREALKHFFDTKMNKKIADVEKADFEVVGDDIEDLAVELNPDTETLKNILGQTKTTDNGYEPSISADPFYADPDKKLYKPVRDIALKRKKGDDCKTLMLEVIVEDTEADTHTAFLSEVMLKPQSYGGGTEGVNIPFNVSEDGERVEGTVTAASLETGSPKFTAVKAVSLSTEGKPVSTASSKKLSE